MYLFMLISIRLSKDKKRVVPRKNRVLPKGYTPRSFVFKTKDKGEYFVGFVLNELFMVKIGDAFSVHSVGPKIIFFQKIENKGQVRH